MGSWRRWPARVVLALLLLLAALGLGLAAFSLEAAFATTTARQRWASAGLGHYQMEVRWVSGGYVAHNLLEVRNGRIVGGSDLFTGKPLTRIDIGVMGYLFPVERMFDEIDGLQRWPSGWRGAGVRLLPWLADRIDPCNTPPPLVRYDAERGYPIELRAFANPCFSGIGYAARVDRLTPLP